MIRRPGMARPNPWKAARTRSAFRHRLVAQSHKNEGHFAAGELHLDVHADSLDPIERQGHNPRRHFANPL
jgi:hypothetical protein